MIFCDKMGASDFLKIPHYFLALLIFFKDVWVYSHLAIFPDSSSVSFTHPLPEPGLNFPPPLHGNCSQGEADKTQLPFPSLLPVLGEGLAALLELQGLELTWGKCHPEGFKAWKLQSSAQQYKVQAS